MKSDRSIRGICIAAIKRSTIKPFDFALTRFFETETFAEIFDGTFTLSYLDQNGLPIAQTIVDPLNWTLITTRQIISCINGITKTVDAYDVQDWEWNDFKGHGKTPYTVGKLKLTDQPEFNFFIETGRASMVTIRAIMVLTGQLT